MSSAGVWGAGGGGRGGPKKKQNAYFMICKIGVNFFFFFLIFSYFAWKHTLGSFSLMKVYLFEMHSLIFGEITIENILKCLLAVVCSKVPKRS